MWIYNGEPFTDEMIGDHYGFIYLVVDTVTGRKYIGRKFFSQAGYKQIKGKRKKIRKPSDWKNYYGSSPELLTLVKQHGKDRYTRDILMLCTTLGATKYHETRMLFLHNVLEEKLPCGEFAFINANIAMKYTRRNIGL